jgi:hypothetical protein
MQRIKKRDPTIMTRNNGRLVAPMYVFFRAKEEKWLVVRHKYICTEMW